MPDCITSTVPQISVVGNNPLLPGGARGLVYEVAGKRLIDSVDLTLRPGSTTVIMGPNGAGKSLLLRLLHGLIQPSAGEVLWAGKPINPSSRRRQSMVFQRPVLLRRSVVANIQFVLSLRGKPSAERCRELLAHVGLTELADQPARLLSGGEQQRLALARALAITPQILFLDEPTSSLDPGATAAIESIVTTAHRQGTKVVLVTHDLGQARRMADEVVFLHQGRVTEQTPARMFFAQPVSEAARHYLKGELLL